MGSNRLASPDLVHIFRGDSVFGLSDWQLLERYQERRDEIAFEALVARHGPMVLGVCRRALASPADVEDAFQATFLVLVRRAGHLGPGDAIGPWLHGVAIRVAVRARSEQARRRRFGTLDGDGPAVLSESAVADRELERIVDEELNRLPSKYRAPLVLCYLQDQTHEQAAQQLKWPIGTVKGRLARARDLLRGRLARRGLAPAVGALTIALARQSSAEIARPLLNRTVQSAVKLGLGQTITHVASTSIVSLVQGVLSAMLINKLKWIGLAIFISGLTFTGVGVLAQPGTKGRPNAARPAPIAATKPESTTGAEDVTTAAESITTVGDNKPVDPRQELLRAMRAAYQAVLESYVGGNGSSEQVYQASKRWMDAQRENVTTVAEEFAAISAHRDRLKDLVRADAERSTILPGGQTLAHANAAQGAANLAEADLWLAQVKTGSGEKAAGAGAGPGKDPQSRRILGKLEEPILMNFPDETPLEDVLKHIKETTKSPGLPKGIPIYLDPIGLQEAEKSLTSTVTIDLDGVPLRRTLQLVLKQLGLIYYVYDGLLYITSAESEETNPTIEPSLLMKKQMQAERGELTLEELKDLKEMMKSIREIQHMNDTQGVRVGEGGRSLP